MGVGTLYLESFAPGVDYFVILNHIFLQSQQLLQLFHRFSNLHLNLADIGHDLGCWRVFNWNIFYFFILIDSQVVIVIYDILLGNQERFIGTFTISFLIQMFESLNDIWNIIFCNRRSLVIQTKSISRHVIEPYIIRTAMLCLCKNQDRS